MNGKTWLKGLGIALLLALVAASGAAEGTVDGTVRVLLSRLNAQTSLRFRTSCRYKLDDVEIPEGADVAVNLTNGQLQVSVEDSAVYDCGAEALFVRGAVGETGIRFVADGVSNLYCGDLRLTARENAIVPVLTMDLEDYVCGVLGDVNTDPMEAIKAEAIAARSYAMCRGETEAEQMYDCTDDADGYMFDGYTAAWTRIRQAADATRGKVLFADDMPVLCRSTESNGGQTESAGNAWNLEGGVVKDDPYDLESRTAAVRTARIRRDGTELNAQLQQYLIDAMTEQLTAWGLSPTASDVSIRRVNAVAPINPAYAEPSRVYRSLVMTLEIRSANLSTGKPVDSSVSLEVPTFGALEDWYALSINPEENETVSVTETEEAFEIAFRRSGSGVGLSRCGAAAMALKHDMDCAAILDFYFPETEIRTLEMTVYNPEEENGMKTPSPYALPTIAPAETDIAPTAAAAAVTPTAAPELVEAVTAAVAYPAEAMLTMLTPEPNADSEMTDAKEPDDEMPIISDDEIPADDLDDELSMEDFDGEISLDDFDDELSMEDFDDELSMEDFDDELPLDDDISLDDFEGKLPLDDDISLDGLEEAASEFAEEMTAPAEETCKYVNVKESGTLTLRSLPSKEGERIGKLHRGESVRVIGIGDEWAQVRTQDGREGYVSVAYLTDTMPKTEPAADAWERFRAEHADAKRCDQTARARVNVWMRAEASTESEALCKVVGGKKVEVLGYDDKWACVRYKDRIGFIVKKYLKFGA